MQASDPPRAGRPMLAELNWKCGMGAVDGEAAGNGGAPAAASHGCGWAGRCCIFFSQRKQSSGLGSLYLQQSDHHGMPWLANVGAGWLPGVLTSLGIDHPQPDRCQSRPAPEAGSGKEGASTDFSHIWKPQAPHTPPLCTRGSLTHTHTHTLRELSDVCLFAHSWYRDRR